MSFPVLCLKNWSDFCCFDFCVELSPAVRKLQFIISAIMCEKHACINCGIDIISTGAVRGTKGATKCNKFF